MAKAVRPSRSAQLGAQIPRFNNASRLMRSLYHSNKYRKTATYVIGLKAKNHISSIVLLNMAQWTIFSKYDKLVMVEN